MKRFLFSILIFFSVNAMFAQSSGFRIANEEPVSAKAASEKIHIVTKGETLYSISRKYGVSVDQIKSSNQLASASISPGQRLYIGPVSPSTGSENARMASPSANARMASGSTPPAGDDNLYYVMKKGDDIFSISDTKEISVAQLKDWNPEAAFVVGERIVIGKQPAQSAASSTSASQRTAMLPPSSNARMASTSVPSSGSVYRTSTPPVSQPQASAVTQQPVTSVRGKDGTIYEMPAFNIYGQVAMQLRYGEVADPRVTSTRFYAYHKSLPLGTKLNLLIPANSGYVELEIVGRLDPNSSADIGLSPACVSLVKGATTNDIVTITYN